MKYFIFPDAEGLRLTYKIETTLSEKFINNLLDCEVKYKGNIYDVKEIEKTKDDIIVHCTPKDWRLR